MNRFLLKTSLIIIFGGTLACNKSSPPANATTDSSVNGDNDVAPSKNYLYFHHEAVKGALRYTHKAVSSGAWTEPCKVDLDATDPTERTIDCITESTELDLMTIGLTLKYNVPPHVKCSHAMTMTPFFFEWEPPRPTTTYVEPRYVEVTVDSRPSASPNYQATGYYNSAKTGGANSHLISTGGSYYCEWDHTLAKGPNCCEGEYLEMLTSISADSSGNPISTVTMTVKSWGGSRDNCIGGPATETNGTLGTTKWPAFTIWRMADQIAQNLELATGFSSPLSIFETWKPLAETAPSTATNFGTFKINGLLEKQYGSTRYLANYIASTATVPKPFSDILNYDYSEGAGLNSYYDKYGKPYHFSVLCTDAAREVTARIRLMVREWNTYSALKAATEPTAGEDDSTSSTDETDYPEYPNNDFSDWGDSLPSSGYLNGGL